MEMTSNHTIITITTIAYMRQEQRQLAEFTRHFRVFRRIQQQQFHQRLVVPQLPREIVAIRRRVALDQILELRQVELEHHGASQLIAAGARIGILLGTFHLSINDDWGFAILKDFDREKVRVARRLPENQSKVVSKKQEYATFSIANINFTGSDF